MANFTSNDDFFYLVGNTATNTRWQQPTYDKVQAFFRDPSVLNIFEKYNDVLIVGGFVYTKTTTWDLDLYLILDYNETTEWDAVERDMNALHDLSLNKHRLLIDVNVSKSPNVSFTEHTKEQIISHNKGRDFKHWNFPVHLIEYDTCIRVSLCRHTKIQNGKLEGHFNMGEHTAEHGFTPGVFGKVTKLTDNYLYELDRSLIGPGRKLMLIVLGTEAPTIDPNLSYKTFLSMSNEEYTNSLIYLKPEEDLNKLYSK